MKTDYVVKLQVYSQVSSENLSWFLNTGLQHNVTNDTTPKTLLYITFILKPEFQISKFVFKKKLT